MRTIVNRIVKVILCGTGIAALLVLSCIFGMHMERNRQESLEMQKEYISTIAVVNMDDGVLVGEERINYASQLMAFPGEHFTVTGFNDAKAGIDNGQYAAYIVIPETFSESVTSIENEPRKVTLGYQYNAKLDEETEIQARSDVNAFVLTLNSNIAYMYVDAILSEFHRVQDDSAAILTNDNTELELLSNVNAEQLIAVAEPVEEMNVENNIMPVDLTSYAAQNNVFLDSMMSSYQEASQKGREDYTAIQDTHYDVRMTADNFFSLYDSVIQDTADEQSKLLEAGRVKLTDAVGLYNQEAGSHSGEIKAYIEDIVNQQREMDQISAQQQLESIIAEITRPPEDDETGDDKKEDGDDKKEEGDDKKEEGDDKKEEGDDKKEEGGDKEESGEESGGGEELENNGKESEDNTGEPTDPDALDDPETPENPDDPGNPENPDNPDNPDDPETPENPENPDNPDDPEIPDYKIILSEYDTGAVEQTTGRIVELFKLNPKQEEVNAVIKTCFVDVLAEESRKQMTRLSAAEVLLDQSMDNYENQLVNYDPLVYIESANLESYLNDIENNTGEMMSAVEQNNSEYLLYVAEMSSATTEFSAQLQTSKEEADAKTADNVQNCIRDLAASRKTVNFQNVKMLKGFTDSLKYTRVESQGNTEVYDYIVNPVISRINGQTSAIVNGQTANQGNTAKMLLIIILGTGIVICLAGILIHIGARPGRTQKQTDAGILM